MVSKWIRATQSGWSIVSIRGSILESMDNVRSLIKGLLVLGSLVLKGVGDTPPVKAGLISCVTNNSSSLVWGISVRT